jgi:HlyD family secretion protein
MKRPYLLPLLALCGLILAAVAIYYGNKPAGTGAPPVSSFQAPYASYVAGAGIVEATSGNIAIGTPVSGIVMAIYVQVGDQIQANAPLFKMDDRDLQAQLLTATAQVKEAAAAQQKPRHRLQHAEHLLQRDPNALSAQDLDDLRADAAQAEAALELAQARRKQIRLEIARCTVRAPVAGEVLQLKIRRGEYLEGSGTSSSLLLLGGDDRLHLRVDVDEHDAWRVQADAEAVAFVWGHPEQRIKLRYEYTEPYMVPKTSLTGQSTERTDTRVLQVIYSFAPKGQPVYIGQQLDVYIRAPTDTGARGGP